MSDALVDGRRTNLSFSVEEDSNHKEALAKDSGI